MKTFKRIALHACLKIVIMPALVMLILLGSAPMSVQSRGVGETSPANLPVINQPVSFEHFTVRDGLADDMVYQVLQSRQGFIWVYSRVV